MCADSAVSVHQNEVGRGPVPSIGDVAEQFGAMIVAGMTATPSPE